MGYSKLIAFAGGVAATGLVQAVSKQPAVRKAAVNVLAKGMQLRDDADEALQDIRDEAEDLCADARMQARIDAAVDARRAELEEQIRAEIEAQIEQETLADGEAQED